MPYMDRVGEVICSRRAKAWDAACLELSGVFGLDNQDPMPWIISFKKRFDVVDIELNCLGGGRFQRGGPFAVSKVYYPLNSHGRPMYNNEFKILEL